MIIIIYEVLLDKYVHNSLLSFSLFSHTISYGGRDVRSNHSLHNQIEKHYASSADDNDRYGCFWGHLKVMDTWDINVMMS